MEPMINAVQKYLQIRTGNYEDGKKIVFLVLDGAELRSFSYFLIFFSLILLLLLVYILSFHYFFIARQSVIICLHTS